MKNSSTHKTTQSRKPLEKIRKHQYTVWLNDLENDQFLHKLKDAGDIAPSKFMREMLTQGWVQAARQKAELKNIETLVALLMEYRTNFRRIGNYIKYSESRLAPEIERTILGIQKIIDII